MSRTEIEAWLRYWNDLLRKQGHLPWIAEICGRRIDGLYGLLWDLPAEQQKGGE